MKQGYVPCFTCFINERVIRPAGYGYVEFAIPHFAEYLNRMGGVGR